MELSSVQKFFLAIFPKKWGEDMEKHSRQWMMRCPCGFAQSVWETGGIRWRAVGEPRWFRRCPKCGEQTWHVVKFDG